MVVITVSLVSLIVPYFRTTYSLDVRIVDVGNDNNDTSTNQQSFSDSGIEQMTLKAQLKPGSYAQRPL
ncbi:MAG: hypothetical protein M3530_08885 [Thermoproteota archaeon]|nr:hypothetical protein [Thermoproteota archaeon]